VQSDRLDQARVVILDVADARTDRPANHVFGRVGDQQRLELRQLGRIFTGQFEPDYSTLALP
jgi:hypothetical protein